MPVLLVLFCGQIGAEQIRHVHPELLYEGGESLGFDEREPALARNDPEVVYHLLRDFSGLPLTTPSE